MVDDSVNAKMATTSARDPKRMDTPPFAAFEWMIALRYLRAKRAESFISVISGFSLIGIALGVATLIIVMSVMNGFRHELLARILGLQGHVIVQGDARSLTDFDAVERFSLESSRTAAFISRDASPQPPATRGSCQSEEDATLKRLSQ